MLPSASANRVPTTAYYGQLVESINVAALFGVSGPDDTSLFAVSPAADYRAPCFGRRIIVTLSGVLGAAAAANSHLRPLVEGLRRKSVQSPSRSLLRASSSNLPHGRSFFLAPQTPRLFNTYPTHVIERISRFRARFGLSGVVASSMPSQRSASLLQKTLDGLPWLGSGLQSPRVWVSIGICLIAEGFPNHEAPVRECPAS